MAGLSITLAVLWLVSVMAMEWMTPKPLSQPSDCPRHRRCRLSFLSPTQAVARQSLNDDFEKMPPYQFFQVPLASSYSQAIPED